MRLCERIGRDEPVFSFEFFPPKTEEGEHRLLEAIEDLAKLDPGFVSVTYGAGGSTRDRTVELTTRLYRELRIDTMAHLTCVGHTRGELEGLVDRFAAEGIQNVLALRGDPPQGQQRFVAAPYGLSYARELVELIRARDQGFCVGVAGYPEGHLESPDKALDIRHLKEKVDAGADFIVTQLFFDNAFYFDFVDRIRRAGIGVPVIPGIMPITSFEQITRFTRMCGATIPMRLVLELERRKADPEAVLQLGVAHATVQCVELLARGAPGVHFYTLNKSTATRMIFTALRR